MKMCSLFLSVPVWWNCLHLITKYMYVITTHLQYISTTHRSFNSFKLSQREKYMQSDRGTWTLYHSAALPTELPSLSPLLVDSAMWHTPCYIDLSFNFLWVHTISLNLTLTVKVTWRTVHHIEHLIDSQGHIKVKLIMPYFWNWKMYFVQGYIIKSVYY